MLATRTLPQVEVSGSHREIGRGFGEQLRDQVREYSDMWLSKAAARSGKSRHELLQHVDGFVATIDTWAPYLGDEIRGVAEGAGIDEREAFSIQVRMELLFAGPPPPSCTTFALTGAHTATGQVIVGQNVDLDAEVERFGVILKARPDDSPAVMMYTSPGLVSYVGLNDCGLAVHGNLLVSDGWRAGFPRYLITRVMLRERTVESALEAGLKPPRASSRNLILGDAGGAIANAELAVEADAVLRSQDGVLVHANHFTAPELAGTDRFVPESSCHREERMRQLLADAQRPIAIADLQGFYRDHDGYPGSICAHPKSASGGKTVASLISEPAAGRLHATFGSPCENEYAVYEF
jgi:isopenicillin-N N-acyltransferase-like protein